jgi:hypothetical protein
MYRESFDKLCDWPRNLLNVPICSIFYASGKNFVGAYYHHCVCPFVRLSSYLLTSHQKLMLFTNVPWDIRACEQDHFGKTYNRIQLQYFFILPLKVLRSSETYTQCFRQYMQYIRYGPLGQPHPKLLNMLKTVEVWDPHSWTIYILVAFFKDHMTVWKSWPYGVVLSPLKLEVL